MSTELANVEMKYMVGVEEIKLSPATVQNYLTKGNGKVTTQEVVLFMNLCKFQKLNPFLNEAYLVKFGDQPAQIITGKGAFEKRAEEHPEYDGMRAGVIIQRGDQILEIEGSFTLKSDILIGGWCEVYRKDRKFAVVSKVNFDEYNKGQSTWKQIPKTMIRKVAIVQALREAFPANYSGMILEEEGLSKETMVNDEIKQQANSVELDFSTGEIIENAAEPVAEATNAGPAF